MGTAFIITTDLVMSTIFNVGFLHTVFVYHYEMQLYYRLGKLVSFRFIVTNI